MPLTWMLRGLNKEKTGWSAGYLRINDLLTKPVKATGIYGELFIEKVQQAITTPLCNILFMCCCR